MDYLLSWIYFLEIPLHFNTTSTDGKTKNSLEGFYRPPEPHLLPQKDIQTHDTNFAFKLGE
jgi:hypothetical protein